jgi:diguanylate cyclase (GGDEF)-like protein
MLTPINLLIITALASVQILFVLGSLVRSRIPGIRYCVASNVVAPVSVMMLSTQAWAPAYVGVVLANFLVALAMGLLVVSVCRFLGIAAPLRSLAAGICLATLGVYVFYFVWPSVSARVVVVSILHSLMCGWIALSVHRARPRERPAYAYIYTLLVAAGASLGHAMRAFIYAVKTDSASVLVLSHQWWNIGYLTIGVLVMPGLTLGMIMMIHDRMLAEREKEADVDFLTGVANRKAWWRMAENMLAAAQRSGQPVCLLMLDIDRFKHINDRYGHPMGDAVLKHFTTLCAAVLRAEDHLGRLGGEEFGVLFTGLSLPASSVASRRLIEAVRSTPYSQGKHVVLYTFSAGLAQWQAGETLQTLVQRADAALYVSKAGGRNRITAQDQEYGVPLRKNGS